PEFDATYAWRMGGRLALTLDDGTVLDRTVHGQKGSMHDPLSADELAAKLARITGSAGDALAAWVRSLPTAEVAAFGPFPGGTSGR
ncbi:MAG: hypothetical protein AAGD35_15055, partial [Actinomycetota bacterium]